MEIRIDLETVFIVFEAHNGPASWYQMYLVSALGPLGKAPSSFFFFSIQAIWTCPTLNNLKSNPQSVFLIMYRYMFVFVYHTICSLANGCKT